MDAGVIQFASSAGKAVLYVLLIINIAVSLGVKESSVAALLGTAGVTVGLAPVSYTHLSTERKRSSSGYQQYGICTRAY